MNNKQKTPERLITEILQLKNKDAVIDFICCVARENAPIQYAPEPFLCSPKINP